MPENIIPIMGWRLMFVLFALSSASCSGTRPATLGIHDMTFSSCPSTPNCVSSDSEDIKHHIAPFQLITSTSEAWKVVRTLVLNAPRTNIIKETDGYLHAECRSAVFGFVDDLELDLREDKNLIAVRSASRLGYSDLGVNRRRIEDLRASLIELEIITSR